VSNPPTQRTVVETPPVWLILAAGILFFLISWLVPVVLTETPGTPSWNANTAAEMKMYAWGNDSVWWMMFDSGMENSNKKNQRSYEVLFAMIDHMNSWIGFWYLWGMLGGMAALFAVARRYAHAVCPPPEPPEPDPDAEPDEPGIVVRLWRAAPALTGLVAAAGLFLVFRYLYQDDIAEMARNAITNYHYFSDNANTKPVKNPLNEWPFVPLAFIGLAAIPVAIQGVRALRVCRAGREAGRLCLGGLAVGVLLWITVAYAWANHWERHWAARDRMLVARADDSVVVFTGIESRIVQYLSEETARRLATNNEPVISPP